MTTPLWAVLLAAVTGWAALRWLPRVAETPGARYGRWAVPLAGLLGAGAGAGAVAVAQSVAEVALLALMAGVAGVLVVVDVAEHRLPDSVIFTGLAVWAAGALLFAVLTGNWGAVGRSVLAAAALFAVFLVLGLLANGLLGFGDVKLSALLGAVLGWFGWGTLLSGVVLGVLLHGIVAIGVLIVTRNPKADVPMGPSLIAGAAIALAGVPTFFPGLA